MKEIKVNYIGEDRLGRNLYNDINDDNVYVLSGEVCYYVASEGKTGLPIGYDVTMIVI